MPQQLQIPRQPLPACYKSAKPIPLGCRPKECWLTEVWPRVYCRPVQRGEFLPPETVEVSSEKLGCEVNFSLKFPS